MHFRTIAQVAMAAAALLAPTVLAFNCNCRTAGANIPAITDRCCWEVYSHGAGSGGCSLNTDEQFSNFDYCCSKYGGSSVDSNC
ncbi:hypothetical protein V8F33_003472 [Rhypophila sp. PSN 637]